MDSHERDELLERRREEALARRMGEALDQLSPREAGDCPEADIIAAYHERSLGPGEIELCEGHFAECSRCRKILAVLAASTDAPLAETEVARLGELVSSAARSPHNAPPEKVTPIRPSRWDWRTRWLAPALGVAAVLAIWFAVRPPRRAMTPQSSGTLVAQAPENQVPPNTEPREADRLSKVAPGQDRQEVAGTSGNPSPPDTRSFHSPAGRRADLGNAIGDVSPNAEVGTNMVQNGKKMDSLSNEAPSPSPATPPPPPPIPNTPAGARPSAAASEFETSGGAVGGAESRNKQTPAPQEAARAMVAPEAPPRVAADNRTSQNLSAFGSTADSSVLMRARSGLTLWRAGKGGSIERSMDAGRTYTAQVSPSREDWLAVAAVSDTVAWLAGRDGTLARTTDGARWDRVRPPSQSADSAAQLPDWTGITARDALNATITARDGRRFATQDGGKTWQAL